jgi:FMN phosphatase YigB (HAD superfamily)
MFILKKIIIYSIISFLFISCQKEITTTENSLASWNNSKVKSEIINFVKTVTNKENPDYIPPEDRIATFDNDGTLWSEKPTYFQIEFVFYRVKQLANKNHDLKDEDLIKAALKRDIKTIREEYGWEGLAELIALSQKGLTTDAFDTLVKGWIKKAKHPLTGKLYSQMVFKPMLELIKYLQQNDFKVYIVTGGGVDFVRAWAPEVYGISTEHIIGSYDKLKYKKIKGKPVLIKSPEMLFLVDGKTKPIAIHQIIGKKPVFAIGNSDGDLQMLEWCGANKYKNLSLLVHHTDAKREWAYDKISHVGKLDKALMVAEKNNWLIIDMKEDWKTIYPDKQLANNKK